MDKAYKEKEGKLFYELDWDFITQMAERMASNKKSDKYKLWNWKLPMSEEYFEDLKQALFRHTMSIMKGEHKDDGREFGHLEAIANNVMMLNYQLKTFYYEHRKIVNVITEKTKKELVANCDQNKNFDLDKTKVNEEDKVVLDDLDLQNTNKSFLPEHNPFKEEVDFDKLTGFILDDITYKILKVDEDIILKKSVLSDYIYEYSKKRFIEKYNLGRIRLLYGEF